MKAKIARPHKPTTMSAPVFFTRRAFQQHFFRGARATLRGEEYRCDLYGTIEERGIVIRALLKHALTPAQRARRMTALRRRHLVLLGESRKLATSDWAPEHHHGPYVFLLARRLDAHLTLACHSYGSQGVTTHPIKALRPTTRTTGARRKHGGSHAR